MECQMCGATFYNSNPKTKYCSQDCRWHGQNEYKQQWYLRSQGRTELLPRPSKERWINVGSGYVMVKKDGKLTYEHIVLAEKALGKPLPKGAIVHHMNEDREDNHTPFNLIVCPSQEYHLLLHKRMKELGYGQDN